MDFAYSARCRDYLARVSAFMEKHVYEGDEVYVRQHQAFGPDGRWKVPPVIEELKAKAKAEGLWNMFHPNPKFGPGLSTADYAPVAELTGRCHIAPEFREVRLYIHHQYGFQTLLFLCEYFYLNVA